MRNAKASHADTWLNSARELSMNSGSSGLHWEMDTKIGFVQGREQQKPRLLEECNTSFGR